MNRIEKNLLDLGNKRIGPLLAKLAIPTTIGMIANSLYNVVDTIFIGRGVGTLAIAGIGIVFPIPNNWAIAMIMIWIGNTIPIPAMASVPTPLPINMVSTTL